MLLLKPKKSNFIQEGKLFHDKGFRTNKKLLRKRMKLRKLRKVWFAMNDAETSEKVLQTLKKLKLDAKK